MKEGSTLLAENCFDPVSFFEEELKKANKHKEDVYSSKPADQLIEICAMRLVDGQSDK